MQTPEDLMAMKPCKAAVAWLKPFKSLAVAWDCCDRPDWLFWYLHKSGRLTRAFVQSFGTDCRAQVTEGEPKEVCRQIEAQIAKIGNSLDIVKHGQFALESSFVAIDFAARRKQADLERIRQCEFIRELIPNPFL
jgi:hypothetical protein